jgi:hypothetical protein
MPHPAVHPAGSPLQAIGSGLITLGVGVALFTGLAWTLRPAALPLPNEVPAPAEAVPPPGYSQTGGVEIAELVRSLQLVTVEINGAATAELHDERWRGSATARVTAPVRYLYGVDLGRLDCDNVRIGPTLGTILLRVPTPRRLAVEVDMSAPVEMVDVRGLRLRSRVGEYLLGQARLAVHHEARAGELPPELHTQMIEQSRTRIAELVRTLLGPGRSVDVRFETDPVVADLSPAAVPPTNPAASPAAAPERRS